MVGIGLLGQEKLYSQISRTHLHCRNLLQGKAMSALAARVRIQLSNRENKSYQCHTDHSSSYQ